MNSKHAPDLFDRHISAFDKAEYHAKADDFPEAADYYQAYIHMGFFLGFLADKGLLTEESLAKKEVRQFIGREIKPGELCKFLGGKVDPLEMSETGKKFSYYYYPGYTKDGDIIGISPVTYLKNDYCEVLSEEIDRAGDAYLINDSWENYDKVKQRINERFEQWITAGSPAPRYRDFKSLSDADAEKVKAYVRNTLSTGLLFKSYPEVSVEETSFLAYTIKIDGRGDRNTAKKLYASEAKIRNYLKDFTDRHILFNVK